MSSRNSHSNSNSNSRNSISNIPLARPASNSTNLNMFQKNKVSFMFASALVVLVEIMVLFNHQTNSSKGYIAICGGVFIMTLLTISKVVNLSKDIGFVISALLSMIFTILPIIFLSISKTKFEKMKEDRHGTSSNYGDSYSDNGKIENNNTSTSGSLLITVHSLILLETIVFIVYLNYIFSVYQTNAFVNIPKYNYIMLIFLFLLSTLNTYLSYKYANESLLFETDG